MQGYVGTHINDLSRLLTAKIFVGDRTECEPYVERYTRIKQQLTGDRFREQFLHVSEDLTHSLIIRPADGIAATVIIDLMLGVIYPRILIVSAEAFGDTETSAPLREDLRRQAEES